MEIMVYDGWIVYRDDNGCIMISSTPDGWIAIIGYERMA